MANRILRDWTDSEKINSISVHAERFFVRLIMKVDDYGCFYADTRLLKANLFPLLLDSIREADITRWMAECQKAGLIVIYEVKSKVYVQILDFKQRLDRAKSKYPMPPAATDSVVIDNEFRPESESEKKPKLETETTAGAEEFLPFDSIEFKNTWDEWKKFRKEKRSSLTPSTIEKQLKMLGGRAEFEAIEIINQSITNGWTGLFELKRDNKKYDTKRNTTITNPTATTFGTL